MFGFLGKLLDSNEKEIRRLRTIVERINTLEDECKKLKDNDFTKRISEVREQLAHGALLDDVLPQVYALVREAAVRTLKLRHFDVQMIAAIALHEGKVCEQKTGEGKTLSATPALVLNALAGRGVHLVTVNDYLARRDAGWMGPI
ncbi:MAG: preprotein translocase subunit SecA, partial [Patescibacteria group bacterium]